MKKLFLFLLIGASSIAFSQINVGKSSQVAQSNWRVGGGIGMGFGSNDAFNLNISPFVGYAFSPQVEGGITTGYQYSKYRSSKMNLFNIGPYMHVYPIQEIFLRAHYEYYTGNVKHKNTFGDYNNSSSFDEDALWVGGGYRSVGRVQFYAGVMYNVLYKENQSDLFSSGLRPIVGVSISL